MVKIKILQAGFGDCIVINDNGKITIVDGGPFLSYRRNYRKDLESIKIVENIVLTHVDADHINGLIEYFKNLISNGIHVKNVFANCCKTIQVASDDGNISYNKANNLEKLLLELKGKGYDNWYNDVTALNSYGDIKILSPTIDALNAYIEAWKNDTYNKQTNIGCVRVVQDRSLNELYELNSVPCDKLEDDIVNNSSIAMILKTSDKNILLLGDARAETVENSLRLLGYNEVNPLHIDIMKVSHHGSIKNTSKGLMSLISCDKFIFSTKGNSRHPARETMSRIIFSQEHNAKNPLHFYFNYPAKEMIRLGNNILTDDECRKYNVEQIFEKIIEI